MTNAIATAEQFLIERTKSVFGATVREVKSLGGGWDIDSLKRALQFAPSVYVAFHGMAAADVPVHADLRFSLYVVTKGAQEEDRRIGTARVLGAYDIVSRLIPTFANAVVPALGSLKFQGCDNLFREAMFDLGGTVYALQFVLPRVSFEQELSSDLDDFLTFDETYQAQAAGQAPLTANDHLTLEQP